MLKPKFGDHTERAVAFLLAMTGVGTLFVVVGAVLLKSTSLVVMGMMTALSAFSVGLVIGMFFGLPTVTGKVVGGKGVTWLTESTSLEQIADWLVKIVVGITLTSFNVIVARLENTASQLSTTMTCGRGHCRIGPAVPGAIMVCFALLGFMLAYLWMRRYFMSEVVRSRRDAEVEYIDNVERAGGVQSSFVGSKRQNPEGEALFGGDGIERPTREQVREIERGVDPDDPWKGSFGGSALNDGLSLAATVEALDSRPGWYGVSLVIEATDVATRRRMNGSLVKFFLHPTFSRDVRTVLFVKGRAQLDVIAYGAFTVGALTSDGARLELDLAELASAPQQFRER